MPVYVTASCSARQRLSAVAATRDKSLCSMLKKFSVALPPESER